MVYSEKLDKVGPEYVKISRSKIFTYLAFFGPLLVKKNKCGSKCATGATGCTGRRKLFLSVLVLFSFQLTQTPSENAKTSESKIALFHDLVQIFEVAPVAHFCVPPGFSPDLAGRLRGPPARSMRVNLRYRTSLGSSLQPFYSRRYTKMCHLCHQLVPLKSAKFAQSR